MASMIEEILAQIPAEDLASQLDTDPETAMDAARKALPVLLGGLSSNVAAGGADALGTAVLRDHMGGLPDGPDILEAIDTDDGQKILGHIFGDQQDRVVETLGARSSAGSSIFSKLLPLLAPLLMSWLGKRIAGMFTGGGAQQSGALAGTQSPDDSAGGLGGLGGLLGGLFGGGDESSQSQSQPTTESGSGGGLGGLLGSLFGGGDEGSQSDSQPTQESPGMGGLGGLLGSLLGAEVQQGKASMPDMADLFDIIGSNATSSEAGTE